MDKLTYTGFFYKDHAEIIAGLEGDDLFSSVAIGMVPIGIRGVQCARYTGTHLEVGTLLGQIQKMSRSAIRVDTIIMSDFEIEE